MDAAAARKDYQMAGKLQGELQTVAEQLRRQLAAEEPQAGGDIELMQSLAGRPADIEARLREGKLVERVASLLSTGAEKLTRQAPRGAEVHRALSMPPPGLPPNSPRLTRCASGTTGLTRIRRAPRAGSPGRAPGRAPAPGVRSAQNALVPSTQLCCPRGFATPQSHEWHMKVESLETAS